MKKQFDKNGEVEFSCISEAIEHAQGPYTELDKERYITGLVDNARKFNNNHTIESIKGKLTTPPETNSNLLAMADSLEAESYFPSRTVRRVRRNLEDGDEFCTDKFLRRDVDMWQECQRVKANQKSIRLLINLSAGVNVSAKHLANRSALLVSIMTACQRNMIAIEIDSVTVLDGLFPRDGKMYKVKTQLHKMGNVLDINQISVAVGDAGFFRVCLLANAVIASNKIKSGMKSSMGNAEDLRERDWREQGYDWYIPTYCFTEKDVKSMYNEFVTEFTRV